MYSLFGLKIQV